MKDKRPTGPQLTLRQQMALAVILIVNAPPPPLKAAPATWKR